MKKCLLLYKCEKLVSVFKFTILDACQIYIYIYIYNKHCLDISKMAKLGRSVDTIIQDLRQLM
jgi:hypothetical protein